MRCVDELTYGSTSRASASSCSWLCMNLFYQSICIVYIPDHSVAHSSAVCDTFSDFWLRASSSTGDNAPGAVAGTSPIAPSSANSAEAGERGIVKRLGGLKMSERLLKTLSVASSSNAEGRLNGLWPTHAVTEWLPDRATA